MYEPTRVVEPGICISGTVPLQFMDQEWAALGLEADFVFRPEDPYAVTVTFRSDAQQVDWTFARELLIDGIHEPVGLGDVQVWPCLDRRGAAVVVIELLSEEGQVLVQAPSREVAEFVHRMRASVPLGAESSHLDVDAALRRLLV